MDIVKDLGRERQYHSGFTVVQNPKFGFLEKVMWFLSRHRKILFHMDKSKASSCDWF
jgi:hypothetical protein